MNDDDIQGFRDRLRRVEFAIWGLKGDNGMVSDIQAIRREFQKWREEEDDRREQQASERTRTRLTIIAISLTGFFALLGAVIQIAQVAG